MTKFILRFCIAKSGTHYTQRKNLFINLPSGQGAGQDQATAAHNNHAQLENPKRTSLKQGEDPPQWEKCHRHTPSGHI
jgi:hypothetical protein